MSKPWPIPDSWDWVPIADITKVVGGGTPNTQVAANFGGDISWLTPADLSGYKAKHIVRGARNLTQAGYKSSGAQLMPIGTIVFSSRAPIGYVAIASGALCTNQGFKSFVPERGISSKFLYYYLHRAKPIALKLASGTTFPEISGKNASTIPVPVPPVGEQERIADALDELLSDLDAGVAALERVEAKLKHYRAAVLKAAVEGALTGAQTQFPEVRLKTLIEGLGQGWSPRCELTREPRDDEWAIIKTTAVQSMRYLDNESKPLPADLKPRPGIEIREGDLLMTRKGPRKRAGVTCLVTKTRTRLMICDTVYRFRCKTELVEPGYLELALNSPRIVSEIDKKKSGINDSGVSLTHQKLGDVIIPLPLLPVQHEILDAVADQISVIEHLEADIIAKLKIARALRQSILRHAFTGQLVPQDPNDEPAAGLLERIAAQREERARQAQAVKKANNKAPSKRTTKRTGKKHSHD